MNVEELKTSLGEDAELLDFKVEGEYIVAKFKQFQRDKNIFARVAERFKSLGGEYKGGLGANSHFRIKRETPQKPDIELEGKEKLLSQAALLVEQASKKLREAGY